MPLTEPQVSVVIPLFNKEAFVARAINSVLNQSYKFFELIVVNDGSTDQGGEIVKRFSDSRVRLINKDNGGVSSARNRGIQEARCGLVAFLDADDEYAPDFLMRVMEMKVKFPDAGAYATNYINIDQNNKKKYGLRFFSKNLCVLDGGSYFRMTRRDAPISASSIAVKKTVFDVVGYFPVGVKRGEDLDTWIRILFYCPIIFDTHVGAIYHTNTTTGACAEIPPECEPPIFETIDKLCVSHKVSQQMIDDINEFKNHFRVQYAFYQIQKASAFEGRRTLLQMKTKVFIWQRWKGIAVSFFPKEIYYFLRKLKYEALRS